MGLLLCQFAQGQRAGGGAGAGGAAAEIIRCVQPPADPSGRTTTLSCPSPLSFVFRYTGTSESFTVPGDCGLPPPPSAEEGEPATCPPDGTPPLPSGGCPKEMCYFRVEACGGQGASYGGLGGYISSTYEVKPDTVLSVNVGADGIKQCRGALHVFECLAQQPVAFTTKPCDSLLPLFKHHQGGLTLRT